MRVTFAPSPAMIPATIGTIGRTQGVNASGRPARKKAPAIRKILPSRIRFGEQVLLRNIRRAVRRAATPIRQAPRHPAGESPPTWRAASPPGMSSWWAHSKGRLPSSPATRHLDGQREGLKAAPGDRQARHDIVVVDLLLAEVLVFLDVALGQVGGADAPPAGLRRPRTSSAAVKVVVRLDREDHFDAIRRRGDGPDLEGLVRLQRFRCQGSYLL